MRLNNFFYSIDLIILYACSSSPIIDVDDNLRYCDEQIHKTLDDLHSLSGGIDYTMMPRNILKGEKIMTEMKTLMTKLTDTEVEALEKNKNGDLYKYLILLEGEYKDRDGENYKSFEMIQGRQAAYDFIKEILENMTDSDYEYILDVSKSKIISEPPVITEDTPRITLSNMLSVYSFMKIMRQQNKIKDDTSFDIEDYFDGYI